MNRFRPSLLLLCWVAGTAFARPRVPAGGHKLPELNDLPGIYNLQPSVVGNEVTLTWSWQLPERHPNFQSFGFETERADGKHWTVGPTTFSDFHLPFGTYTYRVRTLGEAKERGQKIMHVSEWSEPVQAVIQVSCSGAPTLQFAVQPVQRGGSTLRFHLTGNITVPSGCHLGNTIYRVETPAANNRSGPLSVGKNGHFDATVDAIGPEDDTPAGAMSFTVTVTAEDEAGPATSDAFTVSLELQNPYAPKQGT